MNLGELAGQLKLNVADFIAGAESALNTWEGLTGSLVKGGLVLSGAVTGPLMKLGQSAMAAGGMMTSAEVGFTTMLGSGEKAMEFLQELKDFAAATPFEFADLQQSAKRLLALGFAANEVVPMMTALGNASAGLGGGAELINRLSLALGQMRAKGKVSADEMRQMAEAGIPAWQFLAEAIGKSIPEAMKLAEKGAIQASTAIPAIIAGMQDKFGGLMESFSKTAIGQWSNLKDAMGYVMADIGKSLMPMASALLTNFLIPAGEGLKNLAAAFAALPEPFKYLIVGLAALAAAVGPVLVGLGGLAFSITNLGALLGATGLVASLVALGPVMLGIAVSVGALALAFGLLQLQPVKDAIGAVATAFSEFWTNTIQPGIDYIAELGAVFLDVSGNIASAGMAALWEAISAAGSQLWDWLKQIGSAFGLLWEALEPVRAILGPIVEWVLKAALALAGLAVVSTLAVAWVAFKVAIEVVVFILKSVAAIVTTVINVVVAMATTIRDASKSFTTFLGPAIQWVSDKIAEFLGWIMKIPGVRPAVEAMQKGFSNLKDGAVDAFNSMKTVATGASGATVTSLEAAKNAVTAAQQKFTELSAEMMKGKGSAAQLAAAQVALTVAQKALNVELDKAGLSLETVRAAVSASQKEHIAAVANLKAVNVQYAAGKVGADAVAAAQQRLGLATNKVTEAQKLAKTAANALGMTVAQVTEGLNKQTTDSGKAETATKLLKDQVEKLDEAYKAAYRSYNEGKTSIEPVIDAYNKLQAAQDKLDPERIAERFKKGDEDAKKYYTEQISWFTKLAADWSKQSDELAATTFKNVIDFAKSLNEMRKAASVPVEVTATFEDQVSEPIRTAIRVVQELKDAEKQLGIEGTDALKKKALDAEQAFVRIKVAFERGAVGVGEYMKAEKALLEAQIAVAQDLGKPWQELQQELDNVNKKLADSTKVQVNYWKQLVDGIKGAIKSLQSELNTGLITALFGIDRRKFNKDLDAQAADLSKGLTAQAAEWEKYQQDASASLEQLRKDAEASYAGNTDGLQKSLDDAEKTYTAYERDVLKGLDKFRADNAKGRDSDLASLVKDLAQETAAYKQHVRDIDIAMGRVVVDNADKISEKTTDTKRGIEDEKTSYDRFQRDTLEQINVLTAEDAVGNAERIQGLRQELADKKADLDLYIARATEDLAEFTKDTSIENDRQLDDYKQQLADQAIEYDAYVAENKVKADAVAADYAAKLTEEEAAVAASLDARKAEYEQFKTDTLANFEAVKLEIAAKLALEESDLATSLAKRKTEYNTYVADINAKLTALKDEHRSIWDDIGEMMKGAFTKLGAEIARVALEELEGKLIKSLTGMMSSGGVMDSLSAGFGVIWDKIKGIGSALGIGSQYGVTAAKDLPGALSPAISGAGGAASAAGGGASGAVGGLAGAMNIVGAVSSAVSAVSDVVSNIQNMKIEKTLSLIEESTRFIWIVMDQTVLPKLIEISSRLGWDGGPLQVVADRTLKLYDIMDGLDRMELAMNSYGLPYLQGIRDNTASMLASSRDITVNLNVDGKTLASVVMTEMAGALKLQGVTA